MIFYKITSTTFISKFTTMDATASMKMASSAILNVKQTVFCNGTKTDYLLLSQKDPPRTIEGVFSSKQEP